MAAQPASPIAPPWVRGSEANATAPVPWMRPVPAMAPLPSSGVIRSSVPGSNSVSIRTIGSRGRATSTADQTALTQTALTLTVLAQTVLALSEGVSYPERSPEFSPGRLRRDENE